MKKYSVFLCIALVFLISGCAPDMAVKPGYDFSRIRRIAVLNFEGSGADGVADLFIMELLKAGFDIAERSHLENLLKEQDMGLSGRLDPSTVKNIGKMLGVDAILMGSVIGYAPAQKRVVYFALGDTPVITPGLLVVERGINYIVYQVDAEVSISARMVDVETGSVVWAARDSYRGFTTENALLTVVFFLSDSLKSVFPKKK